MPWWKDNSFSSASGKYDSFGIINDGILNNNICKKKPTKSHFLSEPYSFTKLISKERALAQ